MVLGIDGFQTERKSGLSSESNKWRLSLNIYIRIFLTELVLIFSFVNASADCTKPELPNFNIDNYYSSAVGKTGQNLKKALNGIIKGHIKHCVKYCSSFSS